MPCLVARGWLMCVFVVAMSAATVAALAARSDAAHAEEEGFVSLFNGKDLTGWSADPAYWRVEDGALVGATTADKPLTKGNTFAIWEGSADVPRSLANFELRLRYRFDIDANNSGIQIRSRLMPEVTPWTIAGYQYDIGWNQRLTASMWGERSRGALAAVGQKVVIDPEGRRWVTADISEAEEIAANVRLRDWNDVAIRAVGNRIEFFHNGRKSLELVDYKDRGEDLLGRALEGLVALQLHAGPPMQVRFTDIRVKLLPAGGIVPITDEPIGPGAKPLGPSAAEVPQPVSPAADAVVYAPHPHFRWQREANVRIDEVHRIQISRDEAFADPVCDDRLEVVSRFVPVKPLAPGRYWWRVRRGEGGWSQAVGFEVRSPERVFSIRAGSDADTVRRVIEEAAANGPARVDFEQGEYALSPPAGQSLVTMKGAHDLIIDGHDARLVLGGTFLELHDCQRVTVRHFTVLPDRPAHTLVRIFKKDPATTSLTVKPEPGYASDVTSYFEFPGTAGSFLGCMDPVHHGKYLVGAFVSARNARVAAAADEPGGFVFAPVKPEALALMPQDGVAVVTAYRWHWMKMSRTDECTLSHLTLASLPGALCAGGGNDNAKSILNVKVKRLAAHDYFGGHSHCASGRIGEWIEGCEFECLADDGPAQQSFRQGIKAIDGADAVRIGGNYVRAGDRVALVNTANGRGAAATATAVQGERVQLDRSLAEFSAAIGRDVSGDWSKVFLYRDAQSNEDFVYRRNSHIGGRAHGVKFNGTRAWIADNHFENLNGNAVLAGYPSEVSGHGAHDVVVSGNTIVRCGWTPIQVWSTSGLGSNVLVRGNKIAEARESAIAVLGYDGVTITDNDFASSTPPKQGAWITAEKTLNLHTSHNKHAADVPEIKVSP